MQWWHVAALAYLVPATVWVISENRRPRATFAWIFLFIALPVVGLVAYVLVGRKTTIQRLTRRDLRQDLPGHLSETLAHLDDGHDRTVASFEGDPLRRDRLATLVRASAQSRVTPGNRVRVLQNAAQTYPALEDALRAARYSIHLEYYSWASDSVGEALREILVAKVAEGVEVRLLYDPIGSIGMLKRAYVRSMREAGVEMIPFSPMWQLHTLSYRNHRKIVVVDGRVGFAGGLNIGHEHVEPGQGYELWRDTHLRIDGPAVLALQSVFAVDWANASGQSLLGEGYFPSVAETTARSDEAVDCAIDRDGVPVQLCLSGPDGEREAIQQFYFAAIAAARRQVLLTSPYFVLDEAVAEALRTAALSGVDVRVMISAREPGWPVPNWAANTYAAEIAEAGARGPALRARLPARQDDRDRRRALRRGLSELGHPLLRDQLRDHAAPLRRGDRERDGRRLRARRPGLPSVRRRGLPRAGPGGPLPRLRGPARLAHPVTRWRDRAG